MKTKRLFALTLALLFVTLLFSGCQTADDSDGKDIRLTTIFAGWPWYESVDVLADRATDIYEGTITDISFRIVEKDSVAKPLELITLYEVTLTSSFKGQNAEKLYIEVDAGCQYYNLKEQAILIGNRPEIKPFRKGKPYKIIGVLVCPTLPGFV